MIFKVVVLFLVFIAVVAMLGKLRWLGLPGGIRSARVNAKCRKCGAPKIGKGPCPCDQG